MYMCVCVCLQVDFFQTYIIELQEREGSPFYAVEHFIEGGYIKYNSNSGFVSDINRLTPQTFSHFTFEKSNHQLIVVDIQGKYIYMHMYCDWSNVFIESVEQFFLWVAFLTSVILLYTCGFTFSTNLV